MGCREPWDVHGLSIVNNGVVIFSIAMFRSFSSYVLSALTWRIHGNSGVGTLATYTNRISLHCAKTQPDHEQRSRYDR